MRPPPLPIEIEPAEMRIKGFNILPTMMKIYNTIPDKWRRKAINKQNAPNPNKMPRDIYDLEKQSPYETEEVIPGRLWAVDYTYEDFGFTDKKTRQMSALMGVDPQSEKFRTRVVELAAKHGTEAEEKCKKDLQIALDWWDRSELTDEEVKMGLKMKTKMFVIKLNDGTLMLYNPIRIREDLGKWLGSLGQVQWLVIGSCYHTTFLPFVFKMFPEAKIVGAESAQEKLKVINALPRNLDKFDVVVENNDQLDSLNNQMSNENIKFFFVAGDVATMSTAVVVDKVLLTVDLLYGSHDGHGCFGMNLKELLELGDEHYSIRLFRFGLMTGSPNGTLATYRFHMLNPKSLGAMLYNKPARDGSTCKIFAQSLRKLLKLDFETAICVHSGKMSREVFSKDINANWSWLDGSPLF